MPTTESKIGYVAERLGPHTAKTAEGYLVCLHVTVARSGTQIYDAGELGETDLAGQTVRVYRPASEVSSRAFLSSLNGKSITLRHPGPFLNSLNNRTYDKGVALNPIAKFLPNGECTVECDLIVKDQSLIDMIAAKLVREISLTYHYELAEEKGRLIMRNLRANSIAIVERGRANQHVEPGFPRAVIKDGASARSLSTDGRIDSMAAMVAKIRERVENSPQPVRAKDALRYKGDRNEASLSDLATELASDADSDGGDYGKAMSGFLGKPVIRATEEYRQRQIERTHDAASRRATDGTADDEAAASFESTCRARFSEGQR